MKTFKRKEQLTLHYVIHSGEKVKLELSILKSFKFNLQFLNRNTFAMNAAKVFTVKTTSESTHVRTLHDVWNRKWQHKMEMQAVEVSLKLDSHFIRTPEDILTKTSGRFFDETQWIFLARKVWRKVWIGWIELISFLSLSIYVFFCLRNLLVAGINAIGEKHGL